jgi:hypothetical protein
VISSLSGTPRVEDLGAFTLTVTGTGFTPFSVVQWAGADRTTTYVSSTSLTAAILAGDVDDAGTFAVTVSNPGVGVSNSSTFTVTSGVTYATWDSGTHNSSIVLSGSNLIATRQANASGGLPSVLATVGKSAGKWYWEIQATATAVEYMQMIGVSKAGLAQTTYPGSDANSYSHNSQQTGVATGVRWHNATPNTTDSTRFHHTVPVWIRVALDMDNGKLWVGTNGSFTSPSGGDPAAGTNPSWSGLSGTYYPAVALYYAGSPYNGAAIVTANFGATAFQYSVPSGFNSGMY